MRAISKCWRNAGCLRICQACLDDGPLTEEMLNDKARRLLGVLEKARLFTHPELQPERAENKPQHRRILREAAR